MPTIARCPRPTTVQRDEALLDEAATLLAESAWAVSERREFASRVAEVAGPVGPDVLWLITVGRCVQPRARDEDGVPLTWREIGSPEAARRLLIIAAMAKAHRTRAQHRHGNTAAAIERLAAWLEDHIHARVSYVRSIEAAVRSQHAEHVTAQSGWLQSA
jgi:hypothetical protein